MNGKQKLTNAIYINSVQFPDGVVEYTSIIVYYVHMHPKPKVDKIDVAIFQLLISFLFI